MMEEYYFITFESTNHALEAEDYLKSNNYSIVVIPTPREVTQSCGLSIKFNSECLDQIKDYIKNGSLNSKGIYHLKKEKGTRSIERINS